MSSFFTWGNASSKQTHLRQTNVAVNPDAMEGVTPRYSQESHQDLLSSGQERTDSWACLSQLVRKVMREEFQQFKLEQTVRILTLCPHFHSDFDKV